MDINQLYLHLYMGEVILPVSALEPYAKSKPELRIFAGYCKQKCRASHYKEVRH